MSDVLYECDSSYVSYVYKEYVISIKCGFGVVFIDCGRFRFGFGVGGGFDDGVGVGGVSGGRVMVRCGNDGVNFG